MKKHIVLTVFLVVQFVGVVSLEFWSLFPSSLGMILWPTAMVVLFPGDFLGGWLIEKLFWHRSLSLGSIDFLSAVTAVLINGVIWFFVVKVFRLIFGRRSAARSSRTTAAQ